MLYAEGRRCLICDDYVRDEDLKDCEACGFKFCTSCQKDHQPDCEEELNEWESRE